MELLRRVIIFYKRHFTSCEDYARYIGVKIGKGCDIVTKNFSSEPYLIEIGDYVRIASKTAFFTHGGVRCSIRKYYNNPTLDYFGKIKIGDYTYIGENCMIMPGVTIGTRCMIGAGTVLTKSVPDGCMVAGNPCRFIGYTDNFYQKIIKFDVKTAGKSASDKKKILLELTEDSFIKKGFVKVN